VDVLLVKEDSDVMIVSQNGKMIRIESSTIRQAGRSTQGVRLVNLEDGDKVAAASVLAEAEETPPDETDLLPLQ
jgi:DNA gyrase subunit A